MLKRPDENFWSINYKNHKTNYAFIGTENDSRGDEFEDPVSSSPLEMKPAYELTT